MSVFSIDRLQRGKVSGQRVVNGSFMTSLETTLQTSAKPKTSLGGGPARSDAGPSDSMGKLAIFSIHELVGKVALYEQGTTYSCDQLSRLVARRMERTQSLVWRVGGQLQPYLA